MKPFAKLKSWNDARIERAQERRAADLKLATREFERAFEIEANPPEGRTPTLRQIDKELCLIRLKLLFLADNGERIHWENRRAEAFFVEVKAAL